MFEKLKSRGGCFEEHWSDNLKQEKPRKIAGYLGKFLTRARDPDSRTAEQGAGTGGGAVPEDATIVGAKTKEATDRNPEKPKKLRVQDNSVAIKLTALDRPGPSRTQPEKKSISKPEQSKSTQDKATQIMRQNLSAQRLRENEDIDDDDSSLAENTPNRPKYILIGWDNFRSRLMVALLILLLLWAAIYFPLIGT